jgi:hypothetical protein
MQAAAQRGGGGGGGGIRIGTLRSRSGGIAARGVAAINQGSYSESDDNDDEHAYVNIP